MENLKGDEAVETDVHRLINNTLFIGFYVQNFTYLIYSFWMLRKFKSLYYEGFSNTDTRKYAYLLQLNSIVFIVFVASAIKNFLLYKSDNLPEYAIAIVIFLVLVLFCWIIFKALQSPGLFKNDETVLPPVRELVKEDNQARAKPTHGEKIEGLNKDIDEMAKQVESYMQKNEPFLDASLSLHDLSRQLKIPSRELSILINHHLNKHFFDFVNEYRIEKAKQLLIDPDKNDFTVLEILYDVGFNSKSSFNTAFKKHTGYTPTQYRKSHSLSAA